MGTADEWYRSPAWDDVARLEFERRLARARPWNRVQYRRAKGAAMLASADPRARAAGHALLEANAVDPEAGFERTWALAILGKYELDAGHPDAAEPYLRAALDRLAIDRSGGSGLEPTMLAEVLLRRDDAASLREARSLLDRNLDDPPILVRDRYRMYLAGARVAVALGEPDARVWAVEALRCATATHSGLRNHPKLGLFSAEGRTVAWLRRVASETGHLSQ